MTSHDCQPQRRRGFSQRSQGKEGKIQKDDFVKSGTELLFGQLAKRFVLNFSI
jgi:hypothetical protein